MAKLVKMTKTAILFVGSMQDKQLLSITMGKDSIRMHCLIIRLLPRNLSELGDKLNTII